MNALYHAIWSLPGLRRLAFGPIAAPSGLDRSDRTGHHSFTKIGPGGERMLLVLDADSHRAVETVSVDGQISSETVTPIGGLDLADWYTRHFVALLSDGWQPVAVTPPLQVPPHPEGDA